MKALTLWQPWASAILCGLKNYETRSWSTKHRGPLAIHASKNVPSQIVRDFSYKNLYQEVMDKMGELFDFDGKELPTSCIVTVCKVRGCFPIGVIGQPGSFRSDLDERELRFGNYLPSRFAWSLGDVVSGFKPVHCAGTQGLWNIPEDVSREVVLQLGTRQEYHLETR